MLAANGFITNNNHLGQQAPLSLETMLAVPNSHHNKHIKTLTLLPPLGRRGPAGPHLGSVGQHWWSIESAKSVSRASLPWKARASSLSFQNFRILANVSSRFFFFFLLQNESYRYLPMHVHGPLWVPMTHSRS